MTKIPTQILFVCTGNTCRSPMAEFVMKYLVRKAGLEEKVYVASAGCSVPEGKDISKGTRGILEKYAIPFEERKSAQFVASDYDVYDYIVGIDSGNVDGILEIAGGDPKGKVHLLMEFTGEAREVNDPFATKNYDKTYEDILEGCKALLGRLC